MRWPDFIMIGAMKSGTTALADQLGRHPGIFVSDPKEPNYFVGRYARGPGWYGRLFEGVPPSTRCGEASTAYTKWPDSGCAQRIRSDVPQARLIYLIREPIERMRSHWRYLSIRGTEHRPFVDAVQDDPRYVVTSCYGRQLLPYLEHFDVGQILVLTSDELRADPASVVNRVAEFVDAPGRAHVTPIHSNVSRDLGRWRGPLNRLRRSTELKGLYRALPDVVKRSLRRSLQRDVGALDTSLPAALEAELRERFRQDLARLAPYDVLPATGWITDMVDSS